MMRRLRCGLVAIVASGCARPAAPASIPSTTTSQPAQTAPSSTAPPVQRRDVIISVGDSFSPQRGVEALRAFKAAVVATDSGGECMLMRTGGSGATIVNASFPSRSASKMTVTLTFDSAGHLVRYSESRGLVPRITTRDLTPAQRDSALRANLNAVRRTMISLDWPADQAMVINRGAGQPSDGIVGTVREVETLTQLGPVTTRVERVRHLCGV